MSNKLKATLLTGWKFLFYTALAAGITTASSELSHTPIPVFIIPLVASVLKSIATFLTVEASKTE